MKPQFPVIQARGIVIVSKFDVTKFRSIDIILDEKISTTTQEKK